LIAMNHVRWRRFLGSALTMFLGDGGPFRDVDVVWSLLNLKE